MLYLLLLKLVRLMYEVLILKVHLKKRLQQHRGVPRCSPALGLKVADVRHLGALVVLGLELELDLVEGVGIIVLRIFHASVQV